MRELSRVNLYKYIIGIINNRREIDFPVEVVWELYQEDMLVQLLEINISLLSHIETFFLVDLSRDEQNTEISVTELIRLYSYGIRNIESNNYSSILTEKEFIKLKSIESILESGDDKVSRLKKMNSPYYIFNSIINILSEINNNVIARMEKRDIINISIRGNISNDVFLSHAFDDKLYTLALFIFMLKKGILLYVDWLFSPELKSGEDIKSNLIKHISNSKQLLFLRTVNSELSILGSGNIRGWCSWELGTFYALNGESSDEKYYVQLYNRKNMKSVNKQLDGIKPLQNISNGRLE
jgi:hypothetical protein